MKSSKNNKLVEVIHFFKFFIFVPNFSNVWNFGFLIDFVWADTSYMQILVKIFD